ncbi:MAG: hypothetical protein EZS28_001520 [Streblomastix strix]|uniref:SPRY domain-containing protein n=1 Tax=Streblomastix strix TaxID=222440 RepID=A0A5J4X6V3_9EUKA|nr:MAG: hypothetical protein EZS28_001520 [Streblomastix strix]
MVETQMYELQFAETVHTSRDLMKEEIPMMLNGLIQGNAAQKCQITKRLVSSAFHDADSIMSICQLFLSPLVVMVKSSTPETSVAAKEALVTLISRSTEVRDSLIQSGFVESARYALVDERTPEHTQSNVLDVITQLIFSEANPADMCGLYFILQKKSTSSDEALKGVTKKAKLIQGCLQIREAHSEAMPDDLYQLLTDFLVFKTETQGNQRENEELKRIIQEYRYKEEELKKNLYEKQQKLDEKNRQIDEFRRMDDEKKDMIEKVKKKDEMIKQKISELEIQLSGVKAKPFDIPISITVQPGSQTKKEDESTYTSTSRDCETFPIDTVMRLGIYKCEIRIDQVDKPWFGVMKSTMIVPSGKSPGHDPYCKDNAFFRYDGQVFNNGIGVSGNQTMRSGDKIAIEVNMTVFPRTAHLFINGAQQPIFIKGLPELVKIYFFIRNISDSVTILSLRSLPDPTAIEIRNSKAIQWIV